MLLIALALVCCLVFSVSGVSATSSVEEQQAENLTAGDLGRAVGMSKKDQKEIVIPNAYLSWWSANPGSVTVVFGADGVKNVQKVVILVDGGVVLTITPQKTTAAKVLPKNVELIEGSFVRDDFNLTASGHYQIEARLYYSGAGYYPMMYDIYLQEFDFYLSNPEFADCDTVKVRYSVNPVFVEVEEGDEVDIRIEGLGEFQAEIEKGEWGNFYAVIDMSVDKYNTLLGDGYQFPTLTEFTINGESVSRDIWYWEPYENDCAE